MALANVRDAEALVRKGATFFISHSGGKDSQAMYAEICAVVPATLIKVVHADLGVVEWEGVQDHIQETVDHPVNVVRAGKSFFDMVRHRARTRPDVPSWPSSGTRQCTSDLKRAPIHKFIRKVMKAENATFAVNCIGLRAEESPSRAKKDSWRLNAALSKAGRTVYDWLPIHHYAEDAVFDAIRRAGQQPFWAYQAGNKRLSCVFCIMGCNADLKNGARFRPELYQQILDLEEETGWTFFPGRSLRDRVESPSQPANLQKEAKDG